MPQKIEFINPLKQVLIYALIFLNQSFASGLIAFQNLTGGQYSPQGDIAFSRSQDPSALIINPAGLSQMDKESLSFSASSLSYFNFKSQSENFSNQGDNLKFIDILPNSLVSIHRLQFLDHDYILGLGLFNQINNTAQSQALFSSSAFSYSESINNQMTSNQYLISLVPNQKDQSLQWGIALQFNQVRGKFDSVFSSKSSFNNLQTTEDTISQYEGTYLSYSFKLGTRWQHSWGTTSLLWNSPAKLMSYSLSETENSTSFSNSENSSTQEFKKASIENLSGFAIDSSWVEPPSFTIAQSYNLSQGSVEFFYRHTSPLDYNISYNANKRIQTTIIENQNQSIKDEIIVESRGQSPFYTQTHELGFAMERALNEKYKCGFSYHRWWQDAEEYKVSNFRSTLGITKQSDQFLQILTLSFTESFSQGENSTGRFTNIALIFGGSYSY